jgi:hypothetical protein
MVKTRAIPPLHLATFPPFIRPLAHHLCLSFLFLLPFIQRLEENILRPEEKNHIEFVDVTTVGECYNVSSDKVIEWIKEGKISGKQSTTNPEHYLIPIEEFQYLKTRREQDETEEAIRELLGKSYEKDWDIEMEE